MATPARFLIVLAVSAAAMLAVPTAASARLPYPWHPRPTPTKTTATPTPTKTTATPTPTKTTATPTPSPTSTSVSPTDTSTTPTPTDTSTASPPPVSDGSCGGEVVLKASGDPWRCTFDDEFSSNTLDTSKWTTVTTSQTAYHSGAECFVDSSNNVSIADGVLSLTVRQEAAPFVCVSSSGTNYTSQYTSGSVTTANKFTQTYGRFEVSAAFPAATVAGLQSALWLYPANSAKYGVWPWSGEIDIAEEYSKYADRAIPYIHYVPSILDFKVTNNYCTLSDISAFHSYVVEWTPTTITISYDGKTCTTDNWSPLSLLKPAPFDSPFFLALTQALGVATNVFNPSTTPLPATTKVDYVRVWS